MLECAERRTFRSLTFVLLKRENTPVVSMASSSASSSSEHQEQDGGNIEQPAILVNDKQESSWDGAIEFDSILRAMDEIQDHALNQHEEYLNSKKTINDLETQINALCKRTNQIKIKNSETESLVQIQKCQNYELKQSLARESALLLAAEEKRNLVQQTIDHEKAMYLQEVKNYEEKMAKFSEKFRSAPKIFSMEKMQEEVNQEEEELQCLQAKIQEATTENEQLSQTLQALRADDSLNGLLAVNQDLEREVKEIHAEMCQLESSVADMREQLAALNKEREELEAELSALGLEEEEEANM